MIRPAKIEDLEALMAIYDAARRFMCSRGNTTQWVNGYPSEELIRKEIATGHSFVGVTDEGVIRFVFSFILGADPTYQRIEGAWLNDAPYGTIHRLASSGVEPGAFQQCMDFCFSQIDNLRIDTHADNAPMLRAIRRAGFHHCGVIYVANGTPREAFQKIRESSIDYIQH
jgi:hypothetical protein